MGGPPERGVRPVESDQPNDARIYDYLLGGSYNFAVDRDLAEQLLAVNPRVDKVAASNREFLRRAVRYCMRRGIDQFVDLGSGVPTGGNVHQVAHEVDPRARVVYVDNDPIAVEATRRILGEATRVGVVQADFREPETIMAAEPTRRLVDATKPLGLVATAALQYVTEADDLRSILRGYWNMLPSGSALVVSHFTDDDFPEQVARVIEVFNAVNLPVIPRGWAELNELFKEIHLVEPGIVPAPLWRPDGSEVLADEPTQARTYALVGFKTT